MTSVKKGEAGPHVDNTTSTPGHGPGTRLYTIDAYIPVIDGRNRGPDLATWQGWYSKSYSRKALLASRRSREAWELSPSLSLPYPWASVSASMEIAPLGHSCAQMPQPLQ